MIKLLNARSISEFQIEVEFSDGTSGVFDAQNYLQGRSGPLLDFLRTPQTFKRFFIDAGALCWANGLELSASRVKEMSTLHAAA